MLPVRHYGLNDEAAPARASPSARSCMIVGGLIAMTFAVDAEQRSLEDMATPVTAEDAD
jgi:hypothetical protein